MKKFLIFVLFAVLPAAVLAQEEPDPQLIADFRENIFRAGVNMDPYEYIPGPQTPVPAGYKPFYISHYGRHGSRSNWGGKLYEDIQDKFTRAGKAGLLTEEGDAARKEIDELIRLYDNMDGRLTWLGSQEHRQIAQRMYKKYPQVFRKGSRKITARSSIVPRCIVSMGAFTGELLSLQKDLDVRWDTGEELMRILSTDSSRPVKDSVNRILARLAREHTPDTAAFLRRIFTDPVAGRALTGNPAFMMNETFQMATGTAAFGLDDTLFRLFSYEDLYYFSRPITMSFYLRQCNAAGFGDERMKVVVPLIEDVIEKADDAIATGEYAADFRFGHDYQLLAFGSFLDLEGVGERMDENTCRSWAGWKYTPFAANIQLIFFRNRKGDVLVKMLLNEREARILDLDGGPYYRWEDVRAFLQKRCEQYR